MTALSNVEAKKRFEFLEAVSGTMDAHLRYFKQVNSCKLFLAYSLTVSAYSYSSFTSSLQGYELLHQMEPYINQVVFYFVFG